MADTTNYEYTYLLEANGTKIQGEFTQAVGARNEADARKSAWNFGRSKSGDANPTVVRLISTNDPVVNRFMGWL
jgi:hypothetical protein